MLRDTILSLNLQTEKKTGFYITPILIREKDAEIKDHQECKKSIGMQTDFRFWENL